MDCIITIDIGTSTVRIFAFEMGGNIIAAMKTKGIKRLIVVTSLGVGDSKDQVPFAFKMIFFTSA